MRHIVSTCAAAALLYVQAALASERPLPKDTDLVSASFLACEASDLSLAIYRVRLIPESEELKLRMYEALRNREDLCQTVDAQLPFGILSICSRIVYVMCGMVPVYAEGFLFYGILPPGKTVP